MTSMPASRSAMATTLAPRSCPSRPGLATRTRMGLTGFVILRSRSDEGPSAAAVTKKVLRFAQDDRREARSDDIRRLVLSEHFAQRVADLADGGIGAHRLQDGWHQVVRALGGARQRLERAR